MSIFGPDPPGWPQPRETSWSRYRLYESGRSSKENSRRYDERSSSSFNIDDLLMEVYGKDVPFHTFDRRIHYESFLEFQLYQRFNPRLAPGEGNIYVPNRISTYSKYMLAVLEESDE